MHKNTQKIGKFFYHILKGNFHRCNHYMHERPKICPALRKIPSPCKILFKNLLLCKNRAGHILVHEENQTQYYTVKYTAPTTRATLR